MLYNILQRKTFKIIFVITNIYNDKFDNVL